MAGRFGAAVGAALALTVGAGAATAQVPADIQAKLREMGRVIAPDATAHLYRPLFGNHPPAGVTVAKDIAFGPDPKQVLNLYTPAAGGAARQVLVFMPGGQGLKQLDGEDNAPFYDNLGAWGVKHGLVVVVAQYRTGGPAPWDAGARDIASTLKWVKDNIAAHGGDPNRIVIFGQSNGATQLANYLGHPDLQLPGGPGVKGAVLMSGNFDIAPLKLKSPPAMFLRGTGPAAPIGAPPLDPAVALQRSDLEGLKATAIPVMLIASELDPEERVEMVQVMTGEMTQAGHAPITAVIPGHSHISEIDSFGTPDESVSGPVLKFIRSAK